MLTPMPRPAPVMSQVFVLVVTASTSCPSRVLSGVRRARRAGMHAVGVAGGSDATDAPHGKGGQREGAERDQGDAEGGGGVRAVRAVGVEPADGGAFRVAAVEGRD